MKLHYTDITIMLYCTVPGTILPQSAKCISAGLEKLTNAYPSVSSVNDRLFPVELTEIADWKSMSEYMLHSNFGKALTGVIGGKFGACTIVLPLPCFLRVCLSFGMFYQRKEYLNKIKIIRNFRESTHVVLKKPLE